VSKGLLYLTTHLASGIDVEELKGLAENRGRLAHTMSRIKQTGIMLPGQAEGRVLCASMGSRGRVRRDELRV
jgi:hypothetical protein